MRRTNVDDHPLLRGPPFARSEKEHFDAIAAIDEVPVHPRPRASSQPGFAKSFEYGRTYFDRDSNKREYEDKGSSVFDVKVKLNDDEWTMEKASKKDIILKMRYHDIQTCQEPVTSKEGFTVVATYSMKETALETPTI
jgi:hypothetical protein